MLDKCGFCFRGELDFRIYYGCCGSCSSFTWCYFCKEAYCGDHDRKCYNWGCSPLGIPCIAWLAVGGLFSDAINGLMWTICCGMCGQRCDCSKRGHISVTTSNGCPSLSDWANGAMQIENEMS